MGFGLPPARALRHGGQFHARRCAALYVAWLLAAMPPVTAAQEPTAWLQVCAATGTAAGAAGAAAAAATPGAAPGTSAAAPTPSSTDSAPSAALLLPGAPALRVRAGARLEGCPGIALPVAPGQIAAVRPADPADRVMAARTILLYRPEGATAHGAAKFGAVETVLPPAAVTAATPANAARTLPPLRRNLLEQLQWRPYGVEERVQATVRDGRLTVQCRAGGKPAGLLLTAPWNMPQAALALGVHYRADAAFTLSLADAAASHAEHALELGLLGPSGPSGPSAPSMPPGSTRPAAEVGDPTQSGDAVLPLPATGWDPAQWRHFVLACPAGAATLALDRLQLLPLPPAVAATAAAWPRATWVWRAQDWIADPAAVLARAQRQGMRALFITVPTQGATVPQPARLAAFARRAAAAGMALWAVEGDPHMALPEQHAATVARVRAIAAYNRGVEPAARLHGVQFDIEPYLIDGYGMTAPRIDRAYAQLLAQLKAAAGALPLDFVVPFWWRGNDTVLDALAQAASVVTVMDYRTDEEQVQSFAMPFLDWGVRHRVGVRIALEAGTIAPERQHRYVRADREPAQLWAIPLAPRGSGLAAPLDVLVLLKQPLAGLPGAGFRYSGNRLLDGSATTFQRQPERLRALLPQLERDFSAWPSFAGMAVHEPGDALGTTLARPPSAAP